VVADAVALGAGGYSCSQAVAGAFGNMLEIDEKVFLRMVSPLAGGLLCGNVCGVVSVGLLVLGAFFGPETTRDADRKQRTVLLGTEFMDSFIEAQGSVICSELWTGADIRTPEGAMASRASGKPEQVIRCGVGILAGILEREGGVK